MTWVEKEDKLDVILPKIEKTTMYKLKKKD